MRKTLTIALALVAATFSMPGGLLIAAGGKPLAAPAPAAQDTGTVTGNAQDASKNPLSNATVRLRQINAPPGTEALTTVADAAGNFTFSAVNPGNYVIEIVNAAGNVIGVTPSLTVIAGATATTTVTLSAVTALAIASGATGAAAFITSAAGLVTLAAAGGLLIAGGQVLTEDASPSR